jgi:hypothetical protein
VPGLLPGERVPFATTVLPVARIVPEPPTV